MPVNISIKTLRPRHERAWVHVLLSGLFLFLLSLFTLRLTGNPNLFPTVVMLGDFLIPVTYVTFFYERRHLSSLTLTSLVLGFVYGGVLGVSAAALLEPLFVQHLVPSTAFIVGFIEEFAKMIGVWVIGRHIREKSEVNGLILGAAAGMGFAALESSGYAFTAFLASRGSLNAVVNIMLLRGILSPLGHGTWTAILAGVLFRESRNGRFRITFKVLKAYFVVVILHGLWDATPSFLSMLPVTGLDFFLGEAFVGALGLYILWRRWREARRRQET